MLSKIRELIHVTRFQRRLISDIAALLPEDEAELDHWIDDAIAQNDQSLFFYITLAAVSTDRPVDSRHLVKGTVLIQHYSWVGMIAWRMHGKVGDHLVLAVQFSRLSDQIRAAALLAAAIWYQRQEGGILPISLITEARRLAREPKLATDIQNWLYALATVLMDEGLDTVLKKCFARPFDEKLFSASQGYAISVEKAWKLPILPQLPEIPRPQAIEGFTMRRAVARISRNDSCPCGSGKKYKRCCAEKDQERLRHSSDISGKTDLELKADLEQHLTEARLQKLPAHDIARLDPSKITPVLLEKYFWMLSYHHLFDRAVEAFEQIGYVEERNDIWETLIWDATQKGHRDIVRRLARLHPMDGISDEHLFPATGLLLFEDNPTKLLESLDEVTLRALGDNTKEKMFGFAHSLLLTRFRLLGIFVARSMIPLLPKKEALALLDLILETRDILNLPPEDPYGDILDRRFAEETPELDKDSTALRDAQRKLETKAAEVRRIKEDLEQLRREVERREKNPPTSAKTANTATPADEKRLAELRDKVSELKSHLNQRHLERANLRRELQKAHSDLDSIRQKTEQPTPADERLADQEDLLLLPADLPDHQPIRLLEFPRKFQHTLEALPRQVSRACMVTLGRLAAGEPAAYVGVVRLKEAADTLRQRIGIDHRLLFRLHPSHIEVVDLINRRDLERRIKTL